MSMNFEFATATRIIFGAGSVQQLGANAKLYGRRALVVTGGNPERAQKAFASLKTAGVSAVTFPVSGEPDIATVERGIVLAKSERCELVIGFGGGSVIDAAKAIAAMLANAGELLDYLEVIGQGKMLEKES